MERKTEDESFISILPARAEPSIDLYDLFINQEEQTLKQVMGFYLLSEADRVMGEEKRQQIIASRLPVYLDAFKRGSEITRQKLLQDEPFRIPYGNLGYRQYTRQDGVLRWRLIPTTDDPFQQLDFYRSIKSTEEPTEGISGLWTDPYLVEDALKEGFSEQSFIYSKLLVAQDLLREIHIQADDILRMMPPDNINIYDLSRVRAILKKERLPKEDPKETFIRVMVATQHPIVDRIPQIIQFEQHLLSLNKIFINEETGAAVGRNRRSLYENALAAKLLTNSEDIKDIDHFRSPIIDPQTLFQLVSLRRWIMENFGSTQRGFNQAMLWRVYSVIEKQKPILTSMLSQAGMEPELGLLYLQRLLLKTLKNIPGKEYLNLNAETAEKVVNQYSITGSYHIELPPPENKKTPPKAYDFAKLLVKNNIFHISEFTSFSKEERSEIVNKLVNYPEVVTDPHRYQKLLAKLISTFGLKYSPEGKKFTFDSKISQYKRTNEYRNLKAEAADYFLQEVSKRLEKDDLAIINALEHIISQQSFSDYFKSKEVQPDARVIHRQLAYILSDYRFKKINEQEVMQRLGDYTSLMVLVREFSASNRLRNLRPKESLWAVLTVIRDKITSNQKHFSDMEDYQRENKLLERFLASNWDELIQNQLLDFQKQYFSEDYPHDKTGFMRQLVSESIEDLHLKNNHQ